MVSQPIVFTDLDGTLLDPEMYSFSAAMPAIELIKKKGIPLVLCSSKTRAEIEYWRERLGNPHPFISENGGGIFVPLSYFAEDDISAVWPKPEIINGYFAVVLGTPYALLRQALEELRRDGFDVTGFGDMSESEVAKITGLSKEGVELAKEREFDEPFIFKGGQEKLHTLLASISERGLRCDQGRFYHLMGDNDKGKAVEILRGLYQRRFGDIITIALGDSPVDFPMLEKADYPVLVRNYRGEHDRRISLPNLIKAEGIGPDGWNDAILKFIQEEF
ncbi:MAG: HAD-IIB family hydrolase [Syntrophobacterales bacterium]|nr:MAG: HAD-IIB family hydrolase [Syntrophobacterales bacterium]